MDKKTLRKQVLRTIEEMTSRQRRLESEKKCSDIVQTEQWKQADTIFLFLSFGTEINIDSLIPQAVSEGKTAAVPFCKAKGEMDFYPVDSLEPSLYRLNRWKIREPENTTNRIIPNASSLILVPGIAFTLTGKRLGRGGGFYDRYLQKYPEAVTMGIGYHCQQRDDLPVAEHDILLDYIL